MQDLILFQTCAYLVLSYAIVIGASLGTSRTSLALNWIHCLLSPIVLPMLIGRYLTND